MIGSIVCLLLPALGCPQFTNYTPAVAQVVRNESFYNGKTLDVVGRVQDLNQWHSRGAWLYQAFYVCDKGDCVHVFLESPLPIRSGESVSVSGMYYREYRSGKTVSHNEIEATEVLGRE